MDSYTNLRLDLVNVLNWYNTQHNNKLLALEIKRLKVKINRLKCMGVMLKLEKEEEDFEGRSL